jgi:type II secretory pathway pseudopilin PulG
MNGSTNNKRKKKGADGIGLIELFVVMAIIGVLTAIAIPNFAQYKARGWMAATRSDAKNAFTTVQVWMVDHPIGTPPAETIVGPVNGVIYPTVRPMEGVTIVIAAGGQVTATHINLQGAYIMAANTGAATDTLALQ